MLYKIYLEDDRRSFLISDKPLEDIGTEVEKQNIFSDRDYTIDSIAEVNVQKYKNEHELELIYGADSAIAESTADNIGYMNYFLPYIAEIDILFNSFYDHTSNDMNAEALDGFFSKLEKYDRLLILRSTISYYHYFDEDEADKFTQVLNIPLNDKEIDTLRIVIEYDYNPSGSHYEQPDSTEDDWDEDDEDE